MSTLNIDTVVDVKTNEESVVSGDIKKAVAVPIFKTGEVAIVEFDISLDENVSEIE